MSPLKPAEIRKYIREGRNSAKLWHARSKRNREFYDGDSWDANDKKTLADREQKAVVVNIVKPAVNLVVGLLACAQMDFQARPLVGSSRDLSKDATIMLKYLCVRNDLDVQKRMAGADAVIEGVGWLLSGTFVRDRNPTSEPVQIARIPARWVWYDVDAIEPDLRDARYIGISRWFNFKELARRYPKYKRELDALRGKVAAPEGNTTYHETLFESATDVALPPLYMWGEHEWNRTDQDNELDSKKDRVLVHEIWYRDREPGHYYRTKDDHVHRFDPDTEIDKLLDPNVKSFFSTEDAPVIRVARMAGPYILEDENTHMDLYPLHPFFWDRDLRGRPYSFVQAIADQQQEVNARRARAYFEAAGQRIQVEDDYFAEHNTEDLEEVKREAAKPNGVIVGSGIMAWPRDVTDHMQFLNLAKAEVREAAGISENLAGDDSGKSPKSAESQRFKTLQSGMTFESHRQDFVYAYKQVGQRILRLWITNHKGPIPVPVFNQMTGNDQLYAVDPEDVGYLMDVETSPYSPSMRDKYVETLLQLISKLPPDAMLQGEVMLGALDSMDLPGADMVENALRAFLQRTQQQQAMGAPAPQPAPQAAHRPRQKRIHPTQPQKIA